MITEVQQSMLSKTHHTKSEQKLAAKKRKNTKSQSKSRGGGRLNVIKTQLVKNEITTPLKPLKNSVAIEQAEVMKAPVTKGISELRKETSILGSVGAEILSS